MLRIAATVAALCGIVSLFGGIQGYVVKKSAISLVAGGALGVLLLVGAWFTLGGKAWAPGLSLVAGLLLAGRFLPVYLKDTGNLWPALTVAVLGAATVAAQVLALLAKDS